MRSFRNPLRFSLSLAATALVGLGCGASNETESPDPQLVEEHKISEEISELGGKMAEDWSAVRTELAKYRDVNVALADGYVNTMECAQSPDGAMGVHFARFDLIMDLDHDPLQPEILLYAPTDDGGYKLLGVEYYQVFVGQPTPSILGQPFDGPMDGHNPGDPVHYDLHVWLYKHNPTGLFSIWNPTVKCPTGHGGH